MRSAADSQPGDGEDGALPRQAARELVERAFREESGHAVATLIRTLGDFDLAEEVVQDAFVAALERWPLDGVPDSPRAWILTTARRRAIDRFRRARRLVERVERLGEQQREEDAMAATWAGGAADRNVDGERHPVDPGEPGSDSADGVESDDRLRLVFTCCHPALPLEARVALTLRTLGGLQTPEIARAFLVPEATLAQRLVRAKKKIRDAGIPYRVPRAEELPERLDGVLGVLYLVFNEGYAASTGDALIRFELSGEAIRLCRTLVELMPDEPEALGLLALMLLHDARREARVDAAGDLVLLGAQDRSAWNRHQIAEGERFLDRAMQLRRPGPYQVQAAIAALHDQALTADATDWGQIAALYGELAKLAPSPIVELNRAVAVAMVDGPAIGLALVEPLVGGPDRGAGDDRRGSAASGGAASAARSDEDARTGPGSDAAPLARYHLAHAARADLLRRLGRRRDAAEAYRTALGLATNQAERRFLERRLAEQLDA
jgi:RNA polymerase sigma-70 factor, ECF subfamily